MEKPENLTVYRKRDLTVFAAVLWLAGAAAIEGLILFAYFKSADQLPEEKSAVIICLIGVSIVSAIMIVNSALCFNNLRYPCILATDEKGIYDYSGYIHSGFISWDDIESISGSQKIEAFLDLLADSQPPSVKIELKNPRATFANRNIIWKIAFIFTSFGCVNIRTICSPLSRRETNKLLCERLAYYTEKCETEN